MNGYTYCICDTAMKCNYYDRQNSSFQCWFMCPTVNYLPLASYISTKSLPVNRRRYQSSRPCAWYIVSRGFPQMNITSKLATTTFAPSLPVYRALSTPSNTDMNQTTFCNVNATPGQPCSWNANWCSSCHILNTGKLLHKTLRYFSSCYTEHSYEV